MAFDAPKRKKGDQVCAAVESVEHSCVLSRRLTRVYPYWYDLLPIAAWIRMPEDNEKMNTSALATGDANSRPQPGAFQSQANRVLSEHLVGAWHAEPRLGEVLAMTGLLTLLFIATVSHFQSYRHVVSNSGDNGAYISAASAIQHWNFRGVEVKQFWGYSYVMAAVSLTGLSLATCLLLVSMVCSVLSVAVCFRLWGGWTAAFFAISNFDWMQRSFLGGSEPLFVLFLFGCFWAARARHWNTAALLASLATITRPLGFIALLGIGIVLLWTHEYRKTASCLAISAMVGALYLLPFWLYFGDPLYQVHRYQTSDWHSGSALSWPLHAIIQSLIHNRQPWTNVALTMTWIIFAVIATAALVLRTQVRAHLPSLEWLFAVMYAIFLLCYSSQEWARAEFPRFLIPVLPIMLVAFSGWLPRDRRLLWVLATISPLLAAASALGIRNVAAALRA